MIRRYDLRRSDNYMYTGRISMISGSSGTVKVYTGFPVTSATVNFATIPWPDTENLFSSSSSSSDIDSSSSESSVDISSTSSSDNPHPIATLPRIYVSSYDVDGFYITYEGIPEYIGYIEFTYSAV